ncbi:MAG: O-antigen ligase family protein [Candidatus Zixiibacteriota bacterium]
MEHAISSRDDYRGGSRPGLLVIAVACAAAAAASVAIVWPATSNTIILSGLGLGGLLLAARRLYIFVTAFVAFMFVEGMVKNAYPYPVTFFLRDIFLTVIYLVWFVKYPLARGLRGRYDKPISLVVGAFVFYTLVVTIIPFTPDPLLYRLGGARWWLANIPLFFVGADVINSRRRFDRLCYVFLGAAAVTGIYGVIQYWVGFDHLFAVSPHYKHIAAFGQWYGMDVDQALRRRVFSTFSVPAELAAAMHVAIVIAVAFITNVKKPGYKVILIASLGLFFAALAFTGSRTTYVPVLLSVAVFGLWCRRRKELVAVALSLLAGIVVVLLMSRGVYLYRLTLVFTNYQYTLARISWDWFRAVELVEGHPFGLGITASAKVGRIFAGQGWSSGFKFIENGYGAALVSLGWPGLLLFVTTLLAVPARLFQLGRVDWDRNWRTLFVFAFCLSMLLPMLTGMPLYTGLSPVCYWLMAGAASFLTRPEESEEK